MQKDVIYIDVEDDITAIIDKLKNSKQKIVALVPPKGNPVLQSTVNLKLLARASKNTDKQPVVVTNNSALMALAGGLGMYVAKNLQSKPYVPTDTPDSLANDSIEVSDAVGAAAAGAVVGASVKLGDDLDAMEVTADELASDLDNDGDLEAADGVPKDAQESPAGAKKKSGKKVPNFNKFKKKLFLIGGGVLVLLLILFLFVLKPKANIVIRAETTPVDVAYQATISDSGTSDPANQVFRAATQNQDKSVTQSFTPTGEKNVGNKATGTVTLSKQSLSSSTVPVGTQLKSSNGLIFTTDSSATIPPSSTGPSCFPTACPGSTTVAVTASEGGEKYNGESGSLSGAPSGVSAGFNGTSSGGTDKNVKVVSQSDVDKATAELKKADNSSVKDELSKGFDSSVKVLPDSFSASVGKVTSEPAVGQQSNEGTITAQVTYTMLGIKNDELKAANEAVITDKMDNKDQQQVYKDGVDTVEFEKVKLSGTNATYKVKTVGQYGPKFDTNALAEEVSGKKVGEVRSYIQGLPGVKSTDIKLSPFWASKTPSADIIKITLEVDQNTAGK